MPPPPREQPIKGLADVHIPQHPRERPNQRSADEPTTNPATPDKVPQKRPNEGSAESLKQPMLQQNTSLSWEQPTEGLANDNPLQQLQGRPGQGSSDGQASMCPRPPEKKATDKPIDAPTKAKANDHKPAGEVQGGNI